MNLSIKMITLIKEKRSDYQIVIPEDASPSQKWAAKQLSKYIFKSSAIELPIINSSEHYSEKCIIIQHDKTIFPEKIADIEISDLGEEGFHIKTIGDTIFILGSKLRGSMYGVFTFLENYVGCRFYAPELEFIPEHDTLIIPEIDDKQSPSFEYRMVTYMNLMEPKSSAKLKNNMNPFTEEKYGGAYQFSMQHMTHTFYQLISPKKYFKDHPEYFAMVDGERQSFDAQLCLTNTDVIKIATEQVLKWMEIDPNSMSFGVVQNDVNRYCECPNCKKIDDEEESHAGSLLYFVNEIAKTVRELHPDRFIHTIAYTYSEKPPKTLIPEDNVIVVLCHMHPSCDNHPLEECPVDQPYVKNLKGWLEKTENVMVWHYVVDFKHYLLPFPNFNALAQDIPFYHSLGVKGFLGQSGFTAQQEFQELRNYACLKLAWDVNANLGRLYDDFFKDVFGAASTYIQEYFNMLQERSKFPNVHMHLYSGLEAGYLDQDFLEKSIELFDNAEDSVKDNDEYLERVKKARMSVDYLYLLYPSDYVMKLGMLSPVDLKKKLSALERFKAAVEEFDVESMGEDVPMTRFLQYCDEVYREHSFEGLLETAPMVMKIINIILSELKSVLDDDNNFKLIDMAGDVLKLGLDPRTLMQWFQDKNIADYNENNIWERKVMMDNVEKFKNPKLPKPDLKLVKAIAGKYLKE